MYCQACYRQTPGTPDKIRFEHGVFDCLRIRFRPVTMPWCQKSMCPDLTISHRIRRLARQESDKEDLIRDATALVERAEIRCEQWSKVITIGFFRDGRCTVYFDQDPFYQFDAGGLLRRAFEDGLLYRSQGATLARLQRRRTADRAASKAPVVLDKADLSVSQLQSFRKRMIRRVDRLCSAIAGQQYRILRAVTPNGDIPARTLPLLTAVLGHGDEFIALRAGPR